MGDANVYANACGHTTGTAYMAYMGTTKIGARHKTRQKRCNKESTKTVREGGEAREGGPTSGSRPHRASKSVQKNGEASTEGQLRAAPQPRQRGSLRVRGIVVS